MVFNIVKKNKLHDLPQICERAFTLLEVVMVILVLGVAYALLVPRLPSVQYWREEAMIRRLSETISFLHRQAINDGVYYRLEFDLDGTLEGCEDQQCYRIGEIVAEGEDTSAINKVANFDVGFLSLELAAFLNPSLGEYQNIEAPRNFPSLKDPVILERDTKIVGIRTMRGDFSVGASKNSERPYVIFSPRGFSEFAVIHLQLSAEDNKATILINPFTGITDIYREPQFRDFEWTYS